MFNIIVASGIVVVFAIWAYKGYTSYRDEFSDADAGLWRGSKIGQLDA